MLKGWVRLMQPIEPPLLDLSVYRYYNNKLRLLVVGNRKQPLGILRHNTLIVLQTIFCIVTHRNYRMGSVPLSLGKSRTSCHILLFCITLGLLPLSLYRPTIHGHIRLEILKESICSKIPLLEENRCFDLVMKRT